MTDVVFIFLCDTFPTVNSKMLNEFSILIRIVSLFLSEDTIFINILLSINSRLLYETNKINTLLFVSLSLSLFWKFKCEILETRSKFSSKPSKY